MAVPKPMLTEFGIHYRLESCGDTYLFDVASQHMWNAHIMLNCKLVEGFTPHFGRG